MIIFSPLGALHVTLCAGDERGSMRGSSGRGAATTCRDLPPPPSPSLFIEHLPLLRHAILTQSSLLSAPACFVRDEIKKGKGRDFMKCTTLFPSPVIFSAPQGPPVNAGTTHSRAKSGSGWGSEPDNNTLCIVVWNQRPRLGFRTRHTYCCLVVQQRGFLSPPLASPHSGMVWLLCKRMLSAARAANT